MQKGILIQKSWYWHWGRTACSLPVDFWEEASDWHVTGILKEANIAKQRRRVLEQMAEEAVSELGRLKEELREYAEEKYQERERWIEELFTTMEQTSLDNDIDGYIQCMDRFGKAFGIELSLNSKEEIDAFMKDEDSVFVL